MARSSSTVDLDGGTKELVELGLTLNEARCYVALLSVAPARAAEVSDASGVPRPKVYATLKSLEQRGFCYPTGDRVTRFRPVDPELALAELTRAREHERRLADERDRQLQSDLVSVLPTAGDNVPHDTSEIMEHTGGREQTIEVFERLIEQAEVRVDIAHATPVLQDPERWNTFELAALERKVQVRILFPSVEVAAEHRAHELVEAGGEVRISRGTPLKVVIRDGTEAMAALRDPRDEMTPACIAIRHMDLVAPLQLLFSREWRRARRVERRQLEAARQAAAAAS